MVAPPCNPTMQGKGQRVSSVMFHGELDASVGDRGRCLNKQTNEFHIGI